MLFSKGLREGVRRGRIRCSVRIWKRPHVKVGGRYAMGDGHIVVDAVTLITLKDVTHDVARESGFESVDALLAMATHGAGEQVYMIRFHYVPGAPWTSPPRTTRSPSTVPAVSPRGARRRTGS